VGSRGALEDQGCPDADDDDIKDLDDQCRTVKGEARYAGCPDADGDRIPEKAAGLPGRDACPGEPASARDANGNGCLDYRHMNPKESYGFAVRFSPSGRRVGITLTKLLLRNVPAGSKVSVTCSRHGKRACKFRSKRARGSGKVVFVTKKHGKRFAPGTKIALRITNPSRLFIGRYISFQTGVRTLKKLPERCIAARGSSKPARCGKVSVDR
jgi:hypothetical protein